MLGFPMMPADTLDKHIAAMKPGQIVSSADPPGRFDITFGSIQQGRYVEILGTDPRLYPMEHLDTAGELPSLFIFHGEDDSGVPLESSRAFVEKLRRVKPDVQVRYTTVPGEHGFDAKVDVDTPWLKEGLDFITPLWLEVDAK